MNKGVIIIVMDQNWDQEIFQSIWDDLQYENPLIFFDRGEEALSFIKTQATRPFLIVSDLNLSDISGFEFREKLLVDPSLKCKNVPFIFISTFASNAQIQRAYDLSVNGFFIKGSGIEEVKRNIIAIVEYWKLSKTAEYEKAIFNN